MKIMKAPEECRWFLHRWTKDGGFRFCRKCGLGQQKEYPPPDGDPRWVEATWKEYQTARRAHDREVRESKRRRTDNLEAMARLDLVLRP